MNTHDESSGTLASPAAQPRRKRWRMGCIVLLALFAVVVLIACFEWLYVETRSDLPITDNDRAVLIYASHLESRGFHFENAERFEDIEKERRFFGFLYRLEYEFHPPKSSYPFLDIYETVYECHWPLPVDWVMEIHDRRVLHAYDDADTDIVRNDAFFAFGDESTFYDIYDEGRKVGHYMHTRIGDRTLALGLVGVPCETPEEWRELVGPYLTYFETYRPELGVN